jgi:hypothetical protein
VLEPPLQLLLLLLRLLLLLLLLLLLQLLLMLVRMLLLLLLLPVVEEGLSVGEGEVGVWALGMLVVQFKGVVWFQGVSRAMGALPRPLLLLMLLTAVEAVAGLLRVVGVRRGAVWQGV